MEEDKILEFKNKKYKLKVSCYKKPDLLKVYMEDIKTKRKTVITEDGVDLFIPPAPTPDCVILNSSDKELIDFLLDLKILDYCTNSIFGKFNMEELYKYDKEGTMKFIKDNATPVKIEYDNEKGNSIEEVEKNIKKEVRKLLSDKETRKKLREADYSNKLGLLYSVINEKNPKESRVVAIDEEGDFFYLINPYVKGLAHQIEIVPEWSFSYTEGILSFLEEDYKLHGLNDFYVHFHLWLEIADDHPNQKYKNGLQKYLKYCKEKGVTREKIAKETGFIKETPDVMKYYKLDKKKKSRER